MSENHGTTATAPLDHVKVFAEAWADPRNTRFEQPAIDVNQVLEERYRTGRPLRLTREMLWDIEVRKAWAPDRYIPYVVQEGSAAAWGGRQAGGGAETFVRRSQQRLWLRPEEYGLVLEQQLVDHREQKITFIGARELVDADGTLLRSDPRQALFHVEHAVDGEPERPINLWRIVHITDGPDARLIEVFERLAGSPWLPEFVELYISRDLGIELTRRG
jgi:hypothetical protein